MSGVATGWVLRNGPAGTRAHRAVLLTIADKADRHGESAQIDRRTIAQRSSYSRARVTTVLRDLIADGWIEIDQRGGGRGRVTTYRLPGVAEDYPRKGLTTEAKGANPEPERGQLAQVIPLSKTVEKTVVKTEESSPSADVLALCDLLADRVAQLQHGARPEITRRWHDQMRLLIERGPLHREQPEPMSPEKIRNTIGFIFDHMAEPEGRSTFCWADQIRSAHALRDHWDQMKRAAEKTISARRGRSAAAIDAALRNPTPDPITAALTQRPGQLAIGGGR